MHQLVCYRVVLACVQYILRAAFKTICEAPVLQLVCYRMVPACAQYCLRAAFKTIGEAPVQYLVCYHIASACVEQLPSASATLKLLPYGLCVRAVSPQCSIQVYL